MGGGGWRYPTPASPAPVPTQQRAVETVRAAIDATIDLLEGAPERQVTLDAIRRRSGVSQGSLTHHFGGRDGLIATANVERYVRACATDRDFLAPLADALDEPATFVDVILGMVDEMLSEHRREVRWVRIAAIAAAFGDADLTATLSRTYTELTDRLTDVVESAHRSGILPPDVDARTIALLLTMHAQGLILDDIAGVEVDRSAWDHLQSRFVGVFVTPEVDAMLAQESQRRSGDMWRAEVLGGNGRIPHAVAERLRSLRARDDSTDPTPTDVAHVRALIEVALDPATRARAPRAPRDAAEPDAREDLLRDAIALLRDHGERGIDVSALRTQHGLAVQRFHRLFGTRDALVREARVRLEVARAARSAVRFAHLVASSTSAAEMRDALVRDATGTADDASRSAMWQRLETIAATRTDHELRAALARIQRVARDLLIEQVCLAQERRIMDPSLPPTGIARLLDGTVFWHVFLDLDAHAPPRATWIAALARLARLLSPDR